MNVTWFAELAALVAPMSDTTQSYPSPPPPERVQAWQLPVNLRLEGEPKLAKFYTQAMRRRGVQGAVEVDLTVDSDGKVVSCTAKTPNIDPELGAVSCRAARTARFQRSPRGAPSMPLKFVWSPLELQLVSARPGHPARLATPPFDIDVSYPVEALRRGEQGRVSAIVEVSAEGRATACSIAVSSQSAALDAATCEMMLRHGRYEAGVDVFGTAIASTIRAPLNWKLPESPTSSEPTPSTS